MLPSCSNCNTGSYRQTPASSLSGMVSRNQHTWAKYEKDWAAEGKSYEAPQLPDSSFFDPENDLHPLRLCGVIGKGRDCEYLILNSEEWLHLCLDHLQLNDKTDFLYHQYGVVDGGGDDDHEDEEEEVGDGEAGGVEEVEAVVEAMAEEVEVMDLVAEEEPVATTRRSSRTGFRPIVVAGKTHWVSTSKRVEVAPAELSGSDDDCSPF